MNANVHNLNIGHKRELHIPNSLTPTKYQQDRQYMFKVILRCICVTIVAVEKQSALHILFVFVALFTLHAKDACCMQGN
jgi:hypothetical protein